MQFQPSDVLAMQQALELASASMRTGDVPVGAVVIDEDGAVIGSGTNSREAANDPIGHAEVNALTSAAQLRRNWRLDGTTLVVTLEPCLMCAGAVVQSRVSRLVFGAFDEKAGAVGSLWDVVRDRRATHQPEVVSGVLAAESQELLRGFFASQREN